MNGSNCFSVFDKLHKEHEYHHASYTLNSKAIYLYALRTHTHTRQRVIRWSIIRTDYLSLLASAAGTPV